MAALPCKPSGSPRPDNSSDEIRAQAINAFQEFLKPSSRKAKTRPLKSAAKGISSRNSA